MHLLMEPVMQLLMKSLWRHYKQQCNRSLKRSGDKIESEMEPDSEADSYTEEDLAMEAELKEEEQLEMQTPEELDFGTP